MGLLDRLLGRELGKKVKPSDSILHYELYEGAGGRRFKRVGAFSKRVEFEDVFATRPGYTYSLRSRWKSGQLRTVWTRRLPGPLPVEARTADPLASYAAAMEPYIRIGFEMGALRESVRAAFSWIFPQDQSGGNPSTPRYVGTLPAILHPKVPELAMAWSPFVRDMTEAITSGIREGIEATKGGSPES